MGCRSCRASPSLPEARALAPRPAKPRNHAFSRAVPQTPKGPSGCMVLTCRPLPGLTSLLLLLQLPEWREEPLLPPAAALLTTGPS